MTATAIDPRALTAELLARDRWSREALLAHQRNRLRALLEHAVARSAFYRETLGLDAAERPLDSLPTLSKATFMEHWDRIACDPELRLAGAEAHIESGAGEPYLGRFHLGTTSGASGLRGLFAYGAEDFALCAAACLRPMVRAGVRPEWRRIGIAARGSAHISKQLLAVLSGGPSPAPDLHALSPVPEMVAALNAYGPDMAMGYSSIFGVLADEQLSGRLAISPKVVVCTSEPVTADVRARIRAAWGRDPGNGYATTEALCVAASVPDTSAVLELTDDLLVVEVVDADNRPVEPGETGEKLLITNLANFALPLIRYELSDRVTLGEGPNPTGRPFGWLSAIEGRSNDTLRMPARAGGRVDVLPYRLGEPFARLPEVRQFQIDWDGQRLLARVVLRPGEGPQRVEPELASALRDAGAAPVPITVVPVEALERELGDAGKLKLIRSTA
jgi:phenylacetate-coenzyme A ligase PaaK-like adenylate-forming protein